MIHLTEQGSQAGRKLCFDAKVQYHDSGRVHAAYAPLNNPEFRAKCCPRCLMVWATEAYDDEDSNDMPLWVKLARGMVCADTTEDKTS